MTIRYFLQGNEVMMPYSESNEQLAKMEADNGVYEILDIEFDTPEDM